MSRQVHLFVPCFIDQLYPNVAFNTIKVLKKAGWEAVYNPNQTCCGQPAFNAGFCDDSKAVAKKFIKDFAHAEMIVMPSASCAGFVRNYFKELFTGTADESIWQATAAKTFELSEFLLKVAGVADLNASFIGKATYHDSCAALRECNIKAGPRTLLHHVRGLELTELPQSETCCGFGGTFAVKFEPISVAMGEQKIEHALSTGASCIISTDMSCLMQLGGLIKKRNLPLQVYHLADILAAGDN